MNISIIIFFLLAITIVEISIIEGRRIRQLSGVSRDRNSENPYDNFNPKFISPEAYANLTQYWYQKNWKYFPKTAKTTTMAPATNTTTGTGITRLTGVAGGTDVAGGTGGTDTGVDFPFFTGFSAITGGTGDTGSTTGGTSGTTGGTSTGSDFPFFTGFAAIPTGVDSFGIENYDFNYPPERPDVPSDNPRPPIQFAPVIIYRAPQPPAPPPPAPQIEYTDWRPQYRFNYRYLF